MPKTCLEWRQKINGGWLLKTYSVLLTVILLTIFSEIESFEFFLTFNDVHFMLIFMRGLILHWLFVGLETLHNFPPWELLHRKKTNIPTITKNSLRNHIFTLEEHPPHSLPNTHGVEKYHISTSVFSEFIFRALLSSQCSKWLNLFSRAFLGPQEVDNRSENGSTFME